MHRLKYMAMIAATAMALTMAGCGSKGDSAVEATPTPMATPTPTVVAETVTPLPTSTPAPKMIGTKTAQAKFIYLSNNLQSDIRELYLRVSGDDEGDWGKNLISSETTIKSSEQVQMYYGSDSSASADSSESDSTGSQSTSAKYDMKLVTSDGNSSEIYSVNLGDMEKASLLTDQNSGSVYLRYMSISTKKETDTRGNSEESSDDSSSSSADSSNSSSDNSSSDSNSTSNSSSSSSDTMYKGSERELGPDDFENEDGWQHFLQETNDPRYDGRFDSDDNYDDDDDYSDDDYDYDDGDDYADESDGYDTDY